MSKGLLWQFSKYAGIGVLGFILDLILFYLLTRKVGLPLIPANLLSVLVVIGHNFLWHKYFTFQVKSKERIRSEFIKFFLISGSAFVVQQISLPLLVILPIEQLFGSWEDMAAKFITVTVVGLISFYLNRTWTFKKKSH